MIVVVSSRQCLEDEASLLHSPFQYLLERLAALATLYLPLVYESLSNTFRPRSNKYFELPLKILPMWAKDCQAKMSGQFVTHRPLQPLVVPDLSTFFTSTYTFLNGDM